MVVAAETTHDTVRDVNVNEQEESLEHWRLLVYRIMHSSL